MAATLPKPLEAFLRIEAATPLKRERRKAAGLRSGIPEYGGWATVAQSSVSVPDFSDLSEQGKEQ